MYSGGIVFLAAWQTALVCDDRNQLAALFGPHQDLIALTEQCHDLIFVIIFIIVILLLGQPSLIIVISVRVRANLGLG